MTPVSPIAEQLFSTLGNRLNSYAGLSTATLSQGINLYQSGDYEGSIREFKRTISLDPYSENSIRAYDFMAQAFLKLNRVADAIKTYQEAMKVFPQDDTLHLKLGNIYYHEERYYEAEIEYKKAVRLNPSSENLYSLGQVYLSTERYKEAEETFQRILRSEPDNYGAHYSLGQVYAKQGLHGEAIKRFKETIKRKWDFAYAYYDLGMVYADTGNFDGAEEQIKILEDLNKDLAGELRAYLYKVKRPGIKFVNTSHAFNMKQGPHTPVSSLSPELSTPGASKEMSIIVFFDKPMDRLSVENIANWSIGRTTSLSQGGPYNWGLPIPDTEVKINPLPQLVIYDATTYSARVYFRITQNSTGDGTIDPSHIVFRFTGKDAYGNNMDPARDEYTGLSLIV